MREIILTVEDLREMGLNDEEYTLQEVILREYDYCPKCGSIFVEYDVFVEKRHRCLVIVCEWKEEKAALPLRHPLTGRSLTVEEIRTMVRKKLWRGRGCPGKKRR